MSAQTPPPPRKNKYVWDYFRGGRGAKIFSPITNRFMPNAETLRKQIEAEKLKQDLAKLKKKTPAESRVAM